MRLLSLAALLALAGCDAVFSDPGADFMSELDGTWTRTVTTEAISSNGTVTPVGQARTDAYEVGRSVQCARTQIDAAGDRNRIAVAYSPEAPNSRSCDVLSVDGDARRIILIGEGLNDRAGTIDEASGSRQVWRFYTPNDADGNVRRTVWTLTR